jgi:type IV pilus assembly protein PilA
VPGPALTRGKGFTLVELLIVVAMIGIVAAVAIPAWLGARVSANESATLGDIRTLISAQTAYKSANAGFYDGNLSCLTSPSSPGCIPSYPISGPTFLDSLLASLQSKAGYHRTFTAGATAPPGPYSPTSVSNYRYDATPATVGQTGIRGFAADHNGRVCFTANGTPVPGTGGTLPPACQDLR